MNGLNNRINPPDAFFYNKALTYQDQLTKPPGSLGMLEDIAIRLAAMQKTEQPVIEKVWVSVFAADHGIAEEGVSAFPQIVTMEMVKNFANNGAAVNVLSRFVKAHFEVIDVGLVNQISDKKVISERAGSATKNFSKYRAMTESQLNLALSAGQSAVKRAINLKAQLFIGGEMGIGNTTSASAIATVLTGLPTIKLTGAGTGVSKDIIQYKANMIEQSIALHLNYLETPLKVLQCLGGFEIAALVGAYIFAAQQALPLLIDGFISSVAALLAIKINPGVEAWFFYAHKSEEKGHQKVLEYLKAKPLLDLNMRLGEASAAVAAVPLLQMACKLHNEMATFSQAKITTQSS